MFLLTHLDLRNHFFRGCCKLTSIWNSETESFGNFNDDMKRSVDHHNPEADEKSEKELLHKLWPDFILDAAFAKITRHISRQKKNWIGTCQRCMIAAIRHTVWMILISRMGALFSDALFLLVLSKVIWKYRWAQAALQRKALGGWGIILAQQTSCTSSDIEKQRDIFAQWGSCNCPEFCLEEVRPCNGVTIISCQIYHKEHARRYD